MKYFGIYLAAVAASMWLLGADWTGFGVGCMLGWMPLSWRKAAGA